MRGKADLLVILYLRTSTPIDSHTGIPRRQWRIKDIVIKEIIAKLGNKINVHAKSRKDHQKVIQLMLAGV